jgi:hypothetical protein
MYVQSETLWVVNSFLLTMDLISMCLIACVMIAGRRGTNLGLNGWWRSEFGGDEYKARSINYIRQTIWLAQSITSNEPYLVHPSISIQSRVVLASLMNMNTYHNVN